MTDYSKWDNYEIGNIHFVNNTKNYPHRKLFVDYVVNNNLTSVIEAGAGELLEYQMISAQKEIDYHVVDVSKTFLKNCKNKYPKVNTYRCPIEKIDKLKFKDKQFDVCYAASVLEHSCDVKKMIANMLKVSKNFHFAMFKWRYDKGLKSQYHAGKKYWSTTFNILKLLDYIATLGEIEYSDVLDKSSGQRTPISDYPKTAGEHRNGNYLVIHGKAK